MNNDLIFGKSGKQRIVSLNTNETHTELFIQQEDGKIISEIVPFKYWLLFSEKIDNKCVRMKGDLYYKWGKQYTKRSDWMRDRSIHKNRRFSIWDEKEAIMVKDGYSYYQGMKHNELNVLSFDIETTGLDSSKDKVLLISNTYRDSKGNITRKLFSYENYESHVEMVLDWANWINSDISPSIIVGHNIVSFDIPFLVDVVGQVGKAIPIGKDGSNIEVATWESRFRIDGSREQAYRKVKIYGIEVIDTYFLAIKYDIGRNYESYGLKNIIKQEGLEVKNRVFYDASQIRYKYKDPIEWEKIKEYCKHDADDSLALFDKFSPPFFYMANIIPKPFQSIIESASGSQLNSILIRSYLQKAHSLPKDSKIKKFQGAISFGIPGVYRNLYKQDISSMYPSIIREYKLYDREKDPDASYLNVCEYVTIERLKNKKLAKETGLSYYTHMEQSLKILANSLYGMTNTSSLLFNSPDIGEFITAKGREILSKAILWATSKPVDHWLQIFEEKTR